MATFSSVRQQHVLQAIDEYDTRGADNFLATHGFTVSPDVVLVHDGRRYDARAVMAVAHRHATGRLATPEEFASSLDQVIAVLGRRGFEIVGSPAAARSTRARTAATRGTSPRTASRPPRRAPAPERPVAVCPTCSMVLPATGICDDCG